MKKRLLFVSILFLSLPSLVSAHTGHDHSDGLHERIALGAIGLSAVVICTAVMVLLKKRVKQ